MILAHTRLEGESAAFSPQNDDLSDFLKNVNITLNGVNIRYEDDYFSQHHPFAFGLLCEVSLCSYYRIESYLDCDKYGVELWQSREFHIYACAANEVSRVTNHGRGAEYLAIRETNVTNARIYWKSMAEMMIPTSLWESTKNLKRYIFEAIQMEDLRNLMKRYLTSLYPP